MMQQPQSIRTVILHRWLDSATTATLATLTSSSTAVPGMNMRNARGGATIRWHGMTQGARYEKQRGEGKGIIKTAVTVMQSQPTAEPIPPSWARR
eukprot:5018094-Amphidinium_carterae.2